MIKLVDILNEGKFDSTINGMVKDFIPIIKKFLKSKHKKESYGLTKRLDNSNIKFIFTITKFSGDKYWKGITYNIEGNQYKQKVTLDIDLNPNFFPKDFNNLIAEFKDVLRHEIEHTTQYTNPNKQFQDKYEDDTYDYYMLPDEVEAFLRGFYSKAKHLKVSMKDVILGYFNSKGIATQFNHKDEINAVIDYYLKMGKKMFPNALWDLK